MILNRNVLRVRSRALQSGTSRCTSSTTHPSPDGPIIHIPQSSIFPLGVNNKSGPLFRDVSWTVQPNDAWVVLSATSSGAKTSLLQALTGHLRIHPPPPPPYGLFPFLKNRDPHEHVSLVSFAHRPQGAGGAFYDYTARYGAVREEDKRTLRDTFFPETAKPLHELAIPDMYTRPEDTTQLHADRAREQHRRELFEDLAAKLDLQRFLDLPMIALSNGQTRKARIVKALLEQPELLLLDEPLTGLDVQTRGLVLSLLHSLHAKNAPHIVLGMRPQDPIPDWTTHLALIRRDGTVHTGQKEEVLDAAATTQLHAGWSPQAPTDSGPSETGTAVVTLAGVSVAYGERKVLKHIHWSIHENSRWHLQGVNGAGKTTLLAMVTGEHPQSYTQSSKLTLFSRPRAQWPTAHLHARIGRVSPEMHNAFPRRRGMSVWDAVGTGFEGTFVARGRARVGFGEDGAPLAEGGDAERARVRRMWDVLRALGPATWRGAPTSEDAAREAQEFARRPFADLAPGEQSVVLLMRALVGRPPLVLLDEAWAGMDEGMVKAARAYLREGGLQDGQACVVVSHWEEEVPWSKEDGVRRFRLDDGEGYIE
ncbi:molybdenum transport ATP-binding protein ModF-like protein [Phanerochaete sordida]|uniref:Molybdenum transport ATP-binding protein ModF-like protein n=1 Tax=Phanerochaete sordida TaxID=48140 RepID=A0A9P3LGP2_9APHY|nr:molybdenum transport ATP-binding protein ModF-like protein [Phanerochaete sordida]